MYFLNIRRVTARQALLLKGNVIYYLCRRGTSLWVFLFRGMFVDVAI